MRVTEAPLLSTAMTSHTQAGLGGSPGGHKLSYSLSWYLTALGCHQTTLGSYL